VAYDCYNCLAWVQYQRHSSPKKLMVMGLITMQSTTPPMFKFRPENKQRKKEYDPGQRWAIDHTIKITKKKKNFKISWKLLKFALTTNPQTR
jgi:hypothetical protein